MGYDQRLWAIARGEVDAAAYGPMDWTGVNGAWRARVPVAADGFGADEVALEMVVRPGPRAVEPSVVLIVGGSPVRRLDVNGVHRMDGVPRQQTHMQGEPPPEYLVWVEDKDFPKFPVQGPVGGGDYYRVFTAAASMMGLDVQGVDWADPPEGRP